MPESAHPGKTSHRLLQISVLIAAADCDDLLAGYFVNLFSLPSLSWLSFGALFVIWQVSQSGFGTLHDRVGLAVFDVVRHDGDDYGNVVRPKLEIKADPSRSKDITESVVSFTGPAIAILIPSGGAQICTSTSTLT